MPNRAKEGAPNVLFLVLDDTGFGQLGCYGSPIATPNLDALAADGLRFSNMHTTALCSPSRSCMLTGRNHHSNGMACITEGSTGFPGSNGIIPFANAAPIRKEVRSGCSSEHLSKLTPDGASRAASSANGSHRELVRSGGWSGRPPGGG
jgi:arylsulfatase